MKNLALIFFAICALSACGTLPESGSVTAVVKPATVRESSAIECKSSSTGTCYIRLGVPNTSSLQMLKVAEGQSLPVNLTAVSPTGI